LDTLGDGEEHECGGVWGGIGRYFFLINIQDEPWFPIRCRRNSSSKSWRNSLSRFNDEELSGFVRTSKTLTVVSGSGEIDGSCMISVVYWEHNTLQLSSIV
jgi:hypothetical protein